MNLVLIGFMGSGKTTLGKKIAKDLGFEFIDTDSRIEKRYGKITEIFKTLGEVRFREMEKEAVAELKGIDRAIISTGGGMVLSAENMRNLKENAVVVYLLAPLETLFKRAKKGRPLADTFEGFKERFLKREELYRAYSDYSVENVDLDAAHREITGIMSKIN